MNAPPLWTAPIIATVFVYIVGTLIVWVADEKKGTLVSVLRQQVRGFAALLKRIW